MSNKWTAINSFWNSFSMPAYDENTVPDDAVMPYITYEAATGGMDFKTPLNANIYYRTTSWQAISDKAEEIQRYISGGVGIPYDGGRLWITERTPFAQRMAESMDSSEAMSVRRILIQIEAEFQ